MICVLNVSAKCLFAEKVLTIQKMISVKSNWLIIVRNEMTMKWKFTTVSSKKLLDVRV